MTFRSRLLITALVAAAGIGIAAPASAATSGLSRNVWIPYWKLDEGIAEARAHLKNLTSVSAFSYEVSGSGTVSDKIGLQSDPWESFMDDAKDEGVKVYATVSWFDGGAIDEVLGSSKKRKKHIDNLMKIISKNKQLDGLEIDYEGKLADTKDDYSIFLKDLAKKLHAKKKTLICDIEPRTPVQDRFGAGTAIPSSAYVYANDYAAIGSACDEVRIMAYDQGLADVTLVRSGSRPYAPISDTAWVAKVMKVAAADIPSSKLVMGIPTYGRVWRIDPTTGGYAMISSINYTDALALAVQQKQVPKRNRSGELAFSYQGLTSGLPGSATPTGKMNTYFVTFSDSVSINAHVNLAKSLGIGGTALFKADGATDPATWALYK